MSALKRTSQFIALILLLCSFVGISNISSQNEVIESISVLTHSGYVQGASWGEDDRSILTWGDQFVQLWSIDGVLINSISLSDIVLEAKWLDGNTRIFTWSLNAIRIFSVDGTLQVEISDEGHISGYVLNHDETRMITWSYDNSVKLWDMNGELLYTIPHRDRVVQAYWDLQEALIISWDEGATVYVTNVDNGTTVELSHEAWFEESIDPMANQIFLGAVFISPDSHYIFSLLNNTVHLWTVEGTHLFTFTHDDRPNGAVWSRDANRFISWSRDGTARLWNIDGSLIAIMQHENGVNGAQWNRDETQILTWSEDSTARIWNNEGQLLATLSHGNLDSLGQSIIDPRIPWTDWVCCAVWNADQTAILTISSPFNAREGVNAAYLWTSEGELVARMNHEFPVYGVAWNPEENLIVTWSADRTAKMWDEDGSLLATLNHDGGVISAVWSSDGRSLLTVSDDYLVHVWQVN